MAPRTVVSFLLLWLVVGGVVLLQFWPTMPAHWHEVALILAFGPPVYGALEWLGRWVLSDRHGQAISARRFSPLRLLVTFVVAASWFAMAWWAASHMIP